MALKRGLVIGAVVWTPPVISSIRVPASGQVGSPRPSPSPNPTSTSTPPDGEPTPTPTPTTPTPTPTASQSPPTVGGVQFHNEPEVLGGGLAETGQPLIGPAIAGVALTAIGTVLRAAAGKPAASDAAIEDR